MTTESDLTDAREDGRTLAVFDFAANGEVLKIMRPCSEWIAGNGRGWLCGTNY